MSDQSNNNTSRYVFKGLADAIVYFIVSVIYPVFSSAMEYYSVKHNSNSLDEYVLFSLIAGSIFFYATYAYDFSLKFFEAEDKTKKVYQFLIICAVIYAILAFVSLLFLIFVLRFRPDNNSVFIIAVGVFIVTSIPCFYPIIEIFSRIKALYFGKISKAAV